MIQQLMIQIPAPCRGETNINTAIQQVLKCEWADQEYKAAERNTDSLSYREREKADRETRQEESAFSGRSQTCGAKS